jgi:AcrR family transcriptional regulator
LRRKQSKKLTAIAAAALAVFTRDGFAAAQVADIAKEAGLSVGTLYLYADSKQALFELALRTAVPEANADRDVDLSALPLRARGMEATAALLDGRVRQRARWPVLKAALRANAPRDVDSEIAAIVGELFDLLSRGRAMIWLLDRCAWELPWLRDIYVERVRGPYFGDLARYVRRRRKMPHLGGGKYPAAMSRAVVEMIAWMAMHHARDPGEVQFDHTAARRACVAIACGGLLGTGISFRPRRTSVGCYFFEGGVFVEQPRQGRVRFTVTDPYVYDFKIAPPVGTLDSCGLPW